MAEAPEQQNILWKHKWQNYKGTTSLFLPQFNPFSSNKKEGLSTFFFIAYLMTAPVFAEETSFAYLASQPDVILGAGAT